MNVNNGSYIHCAKKIGSLAVKYSRREFNQNLSRSYNHPTIGLKYKAKCYAFQKMNPEQILMEYLTRT
jgi:hypothetical protein